MKPLSVYIHIPFCISKCFYCDFLSAPASVEEQAAYIKSLCREMEEEAKRYTNYVVRTVFIGGGTPSLVEADWIEALMHTLKSFYSIEEICEITIEVNPGTVTEQKLQTYRRNGINRLSIGLQSASREELIALGRIHSMEDFLRTYQMAVDCGFSNINVDLMSALPGQTVESCRETIARVTGLSPKPAHISAYSLIIEEGTPFYDNTPILPDEDTERMMYHMTEEMLKQQGYYRYEISNYAIKGAECLHNKVYWKRGDYVGFGVGAASLIDNVRFINCKNNTRYAKCLSKEKADISEIREDVQILSTEEQMEEFMFLGLRLTEGVNSREFYSCFGKTIEEVFPHVILRLCRQGLLEIKEQTPEEEQLCLTAFGLDVSNVAMAEFLLT